MPGSKKPRKPMRHRPAAIPIMIRTGVDEERNFKLIPHQELDLLRRGEGNEVSFHTLACRVNWGAVMATRHPWSEDPKPAMRDALDALRMLKDRSQARGKWLATGDELRAIGEALTIVDDMQDATTRRHHRDALRVVLQMAT
jgi:hypothetical protein